MPKEIGHVKNPLTVIAIFAGIAEASGAAILPLLDKDIQETFVWFLMFFPCLLIALFFGVLYKKHHVLYAPSDYKEDKSFIDLHFTTRGGHRDFGRLDDAFLAPRMETAEVVEAPEEQDGKPFDSPQPDPGAVEEPINDGKEDISPSFRESNPPLDDIIGYMTLMPGRSIDHKDLSKVARTKVLNGLASDIDGIVKIDAQSKQFPNIKFDAVIESDTNISVVEFVEMTSDVKRLVTAVKGSLQRARVFWESLSQEEKGQFVFHLAIMHGPESKPMREKSLSDIADLKLSMPFKTAVVLYEYDANQMISYKVSAA